VDKRLAGDRAPVMKGLRELDQTAEGKQILMIFKANRLKPVNAEDLERVRTLCTKYRLLSGKTVASKTAAGAARAAETGGVRPEVEP
jgi:hypothetical protein